MFPSLMRVAAFPLHIFSNGLSSSLTQRTLPLAPCPRANPTRRLGEAVARLSTAYSIPRHFGRGHPAAIIETMAALSLPTPIFLVSLTPVKGCQKATARPGTFRAGHRNYLTGLPFSSTIELFLPSHDLRLRKPAMFGAAFSRHLALCSSAPIMVLSLRF